MNFGQAIEELKQGKKLQRSHWKEEAPDIYVFIRDNCFLLRYVNFKKEEKFEFPNFCSADYLAYDWGIYINSK